MKRTLYRIQCDNFFHYYVLEPISGEMTLVETQSVVDELIRSDNEKSVLVLEVVKEVK